MELISFRSCCGNALIEIISGEVGFGLLWPVLAAPISGKIPENSERGNRNDPRDPTFSLRAKLKAFWG